MTCNQKEDEKRYEIKIFGVVQGVGFRPYIYKQAIIYNIKGWVSNLGSAVLMDIEGEKKHIKEFINQIVKKPPILASIEKVRVVQKDFVGHENFRIKNSSEDENSLSFICTDVAICSDCLNEIFDPNNLRYHYAFTNCTNCGPRYSVIRELPYDRENTTMDIFHFCPSCEKEYNDPVNRRFHAQTNCCPECGPTLSLLNSQGKNIACSDPVEKTMELVSNGKIIAIKGIGGFHLACDAFNSNAVQVLRERKNRPEKPFAIMVKDIKTAKKLCFIDEVEESLLLSCKRPIVILKKIDECKLPEQIAPKLKRLGIMLPYTPIHYMLFQFGITCLVMTSANQSSAPIEYENQKVIKHMEKVSDFILINNRDIHSPVEDSVVKVLNKQEIVVRRARGYTPYILPMKSGHEILALGAEEKSAFCILQNQHLYMSQFIGDLKNYDTYVNYERAIGNLTRLLTFKPEIIACDLQDAYQSSQYATRHCKRKIEVQHHHAHMVSCMVEHNLYCPVIGVVFDGTGLGTDGKIWGGEFFIGDRENCKRAGHFKYVTIQGGDQAVREPWRIAVSYLYSLSYEFKDYVSSIDEKSIDVVKQSLTKNLNCYETSSVGRFFDCISSLLNICQHITYDAQAAIELESILDPSVEEIYSYCIDYENELFEIDYKSILVSVMKDIKYGLSPSAISAKFHNTIGSSAADLVRRLSKKYNINKVVLSGGVFENCYLLSYIINELKRHGLSVYYNRQIPTNDSGVCVGQSAIADAIEGKV